MIRNVLPSFLFVSLFMFLFGVSQAQILAWQFGTPASLGTEATYNATTANPNLAVSVLSRGTLTSSALARAFSSTNYAAAGTKANAIAANHYYQFAVNTNVGYLTSLSSLEYKVRRSSTGPNAFIWQYSVNGVNFFDIGSDVSYTLTTSEGDVQTALNLASIPALQNVNSGTTITFRLYAWGASATTGTFAIGRTPAATTTPALALFGTVASATAVNATALTFPTICPNTTNVQNTSVSGSFLNGSNVVIGPYSGFGFSLNPGGPFDPTLSLSYAGNTLPATTVYVQYAPSASGSNNGNIPMSGGGASGNIAVTANAFALPGVTANASPASVCPGGQVTLTGGGAVSYVWSGGVTDGVPFTPGGSATYTVTGTDGNGCTNTSTVQVTLNVNPTVTAVPASQAVCLGSSATLSGSGADTYVWSGPQPVTDATPFTVTLAHAGTYTVTGTSTLTGCTATATAVLNVNQFQAGPPNPELLYYKFNGAGTNVPNEALTPPPGTANATILGSVTQGGTGLQGGALIGSGISSTTDYLNTGWQTNLSGPWTISFWSSNITPSGTLFYIFGDASAQSFRCFTNGVAGANNWILRRTGMTDVLITGGATVAPHLNTFVYDPVAGNIKAYLDGNLVNTVAQAAQTITGTGPFKVMGYSSNVGAPVGGLLDEFRLYNRALTQSEIQQLVTYGGPFGATASPSTVCAGANVTLSSGGVTSYSWNPGNLSGASVIVNPTSSTTYTVTGTSANGCTGTATVAVNVTVPPVSASVTPGSVCLGGSVTFSGSGANTYTWTDGTNTPADGVPFTPLAAGTTTYTVTGTDGGGCTATSTVSLTVNALPNVTASTSNAPSNAVCLGGSLDLIGGNASSYNWQPGNLSGSPVSVSPASSGTYTVTGTDGNGCTATATVAVTVNPLPAITSLTASVNPICDGGSSVLSVSPGLAGPLTYCTVTHNNGCSFGDEYISNVTFATINQSSTCAQNGPAQYTDYTAVSTSVTAGSAVPVSVGNPNFFAGDQCRVYTDWNQDGDFLDAGEETILSGTTTFTGSVAVPATALNGNTRMRVRLTYTSGMAPCGTASYGETEDYTLSVSGGVNPSPSFSTLNWSPATFLNNTNTASVTATVVNATTTYTVTGTDANGCSVTSSITLNVTPAPTGNTFGTPIVIGTLPYSTTGDNLAANCWTNAYTGVNNQSSADVFYQFVMPACNDSVNINTCTGTGFDTYIHLLDNAGNQITSNDDNCGLQSTINFSGLTPGATYYVVVEGFGTNSGNYGLSVSTHQSSTLVPLSASITPATGCQNSIAVPDATGAVSYVWTGGLVNGQPFIVPSGTTTYTVTGTGGNGCTASATVTLTGNAASGGLAPATSNSTQNHGDDLNAAYYDASCNLIASVDDGAGGNILGLTTATVNVQGTAGFHNGQPFVRRWYQITPTSNGAADVQLYITQADFDDYNAVVTAPYLALPTGPADATGIANVRITKNADAGLGNSPVEITPTVSWNGSYWVLSFSTPSFSQFRVHSANPGGTPLPVTLTNFDGRKLNSSNLLEWSTSAELNNAYFNLQYSTNGKDFTTIAKVDSKAPNGMSATKLNYSYEHNTPALGHNYYRLQQVDLDGNSTQHAKVVDLIWGANGSTVSLYPNPTKDVLNIDLYTTRVQNTTVKVLDMSGRIVKQIQARSEAGMNKLSISLGDIANGVYTVQVFENDVLSHVGKVELSK